MAKAQALLTPVTSTPHNLRVSQSMRLRIRLSSFSISKSPKHIGQSTPARWLPSTVPSTWVIDSHSCKMPSTRYVPLRIRVCSACCSVADLNCLSQLAQQFVACIYFNSRHHDLDKLGTSDAIRELKPEEQRGDGMRCLCECYGPGHLPLT